MRNPALAIAAGRLADPTPEPPQLPLAVRLAILVVTVIFSWVAVSVIATLIAKGFQ